jgi:hypothetical protein
MDALERELHDRFTMLRPDQHLQVLEYARTLSEGPRHGVPGVTLLRFAGSLSSEQADDLLRAIEDGCERIAS